MFARGNWVYSLIEPSPFYIFYSVFSWACSGLECYNVENEIENYRHSKIQMDSRHGAMSQHSASSVIIKTWIIYSLKTQKGSETQGSFVVVILYKLDSQSTRKFRQNWFGKRSTPQGPFSGLVIVLGISIVSHDLHRQMALTQLSWHWAKPRPI